MNELDRKIADWCERIHVDRCWYRSSNRVEELKDHLFSEIEHHMASGMDEDAAFEAATLKLGNINDLEREFSKNRGWLGRLSRNIAMSECGVTKKERKMRMANSMIWAVLMVASALVFRSIDADVDKVFGYLLVLIFIPLWTASDQLMRRALRKNSSRDGGDTQSS